MQSLSRNILFLVVSFFLGLGSVQAATPSDVYSVWQDINAGLVAVTGGDTLTPAPVEGKTPAAVSALAEQFAAKLNARRAADSLAAADLAAVPGPATPDTVHAHSQAILAAVTEWAAKHGHGGFAKSEAVSGKSPSDVYALVDLALRRINAAH